jgi:hypothetical protein
MTHRFFGLAVAVAVTLTLAGGPRLAAGPEERSGGLGLVPGGAGFVTVRVADLLRKVGGVSILKTMCKKCGVKLEDVDRITVLLPNSEEDYTPLMIVSSTKPFVVRDILAAFVPAAEETQVAGQPVHVSSKNGNAVRFVNSRLLIAGNKEWLTAYLKQPLPPVRKDNEQAAALASAAGHDIVAWADTMWAWDIEEIKGGKLGDYGIESVTLTIDVGSRVDCALRLACTDEVKASKMVPIVRGMVNMTRGELLMVLGLHDAANILGDEVPSELSGLPWSLVRLGEAALQQVNVRVTRSAVTTTASLRMDGKALRAELEKLVPPEIAAALASGEIEFPSASSPKQDEPGATAGALLGAGAGALLPRSPGATPIGGAIGAAAESRAEQQSLTLEDIAKMAGSNVSDDVIIAKIKKSETTYSLSAEQLVWLKQQDVSDKVIRAMQTAGIEPATPAVNLPKSDSSGPPLPRSVPRSPFAFAPAPVPARFQATVANMRKEPALLFELAEDGKMTFRQKVTPGEAIDVEMVSGKRWIAIFADTPEGLSFEPKEPGAVWLLRTRNIERLDVAPVGR